MAKALAQAGFSVVGLDAGPRYNPKVDFENDEAEMLKLLWSGQRVTSGQDPINPWSGTGIGGGTLVWWARRVFNKDHGTMLSLLCESPVKHSNARRIR